MVGWCQEDTKRFGMTQEDAQSWKKWRRKIKGASGLQAFTWNMALNRCMYVFLATLHHCYYYAPAP